MSVKISSEQSYAYAEILEILSFTHISLIEKIPKKFLSLLKDNASSTYEYHLNKHIPLEEQEISKETATLLTLISLNYWCTPEEKTELEKILLANEITEKKELEEKYNINNLFTNQKEEIQEIESSEEKTIDKNIEEINLPLNITKLPWYKKVIIKLNEIFTKIKKK